MSGLGELWGSLLPIGRGADGGYYRYAFTPAETACREWFLDQAAARDLAVERDGNGNLFAWWGTPGPGSVLTGSHLDSVPGGGAFDGPLGVVSALAAIDLMRARGLRPERAVGVAVFAEEEGARFGVACLGSRLLTGAIDPARALALADPAGVTVAAALAEHGLDPAAAGPDDELLGRIGCYVELHVEQGRALNVPVGIAAAIWPHGRWRFDFAGRGDHAGTTRLADRRDPMQPFAHAVLAARAAALARGSVATVGKAEIVPGAVNAIPSHVSAWLDARGPDEAAVRATVDDVRLTAEREAIRHGVSMVFAQESYTEVVEFNTALRDRLPALVEAAGLPAPPVLPTGAGHDAGILSARVPTAMLFVRNPTGVSHAPQEYATPDDAAAGVEALAAVLTDLVTTPPTDSAPATDARRNTGD